MINRQKRAVLFSLFFVAYGCSAEQGKTDIDLQQLIKDTEQAREHADKLGHEWSTTMPLIEKGQVAVKEGDHELAIKLFQEAKNQSDLAIKQAEYADEHWQLLVPR